MAFEAEEPKTQRAPSRTPLQKPVRAILLDLRLAELDVLLGDRVVLLHHEFVGHGARILARHVIETGVGARHELHLDGGGLGHGNFSWKFRRTLTAESEMSRKTAFAARR